MTSFNEQIDDLLDTLSSATSEELETALSRYDTRDLLAVVATRVLGAGGGGSSAPLALEGTTDDVQLAVEGNATQTSNIAEFNRDGGGNLWATDNDGVVTQSVRAGNSGFAVAFYNDGRQISLGATATVLMRITDASGNPIFEVHDDGTVHVKSGAGTSLVADL